MEPRLAIDVIPFGVGDSLPWGRHLVVTKYGVFFVLNTPVSTRNRMAVMETADGDGPHYIEWNDILHYLPDTSLQPAVERMIEGEILDSKPVNNSTFTLDDF